ncbi:Uncharacterized membrane protein, DUF485 family [Fictibacillus solisalsi]|uniref:Uncharacterized membrane protein, DUF485 family n=1 Tax=Fictibacillus solisalsi TaxID=459525 RepID=A0A1G9V836_9BACL|nr:DUF485 domain-containing protein [Fictibacillus solisalsi]SDM68216.1 Uncharacterized membrane protein, DUF485 family [Fictibacillus solisalsi]
MLAEREKKEGQTDYSAIASSPSFQNLIRQKKNFLLPMSIFFLVFYFTLPIMTSYSTFLNKNAIGDISWAWIFAFAQFVMTWVLCILYSRKAVKFDQIAAHVITQSEKGKTK